MAGPLWWIKKRCAKPWAFENDALASDHFLEERNALLRVNVGGSVSAYALTRPRSGKAGTAKRKRLFSARKLLFARAARTQV